MGPQNLNNYYFNRLDAKLDYTSYYDFFLVSDERDFNREVVYSKNIIGYDDCEVLPVWIDLGNPLSSLQLTMECGTFYPNNTILSISGTCWCHATPSEKDLDCIDCGVDCYTSGCTEMGGFITSICDIGLTGMDNGWTNSLKRNADKVEICWSGCGYPYYWELSPDTPLLNADDCECSLSEVTEIYTGHFSAGTCWSSSGFTWSPNTNIPEWIRSKIKNDYNYGTGIYTFSTNIQKIVQDCGGGFIKTDYTVFVSEPECLCCPPIIDDEPCLTTTTTVYPTTTTTTEYGQTTTTTTTLPGQTTTTTTTAIVLYSCLPNQVIGQENTTDSCSDKIDVTSGGTIGNHAEFLNYISTFSNGYQDSHLHTLKYSLAFNSVGGNCPAAPGAPVGTTTCCTGTPGNVTGYYFANADLYVSSTCGGSNTCAGTVYEALLDVNSQPTIYYTWTDLRTAINNTAILPVTITPLMDKTYVNSVLSTHELGSQITSSDFIICECTSVDILGCACVEDPINGIWPDVATCELVQNCCTGSSTTTTTTCTPDCYGLTRCEGNYQWMLAQMEPCNTPLLENGKYYSLSGTSLDEPYSGCYQTQIYPCASGNIATIDINSISNVYTNCEDCQYGI